jgi:hypothetical protein
MKASIIILISLFLFQTNAFSQDTDHSELIEKTANGICACVNTFTEGIDTDVQELIMKALEFQEADNKEGFMEYIKTVPAELQEKMKVQSQIMAKNDEAFSVCKDKNNEAMKAVVGEDEKMKKEFQTKMIEILKKDKNCNFAASIAKSAMNK